ncbi:hypothetical protein GCM10007386_28520 [Pseudoduganella dura]|nr:hypothetical protein GCM10007386_28520 [Pseudoduganella dura]
MLVRLASSSCSPLTTDTARGTDCREALLRVAVTVTLGTLPSAGRRSAAKSGAVATAALAPTVLSAAWSSAAAAGPWAAPASKLAARPALIHCSFLFCFFITVPMYSVRA